MIIDCCCGYSLMRGGGLGRLGAEAERAGLKPPMKVPSPAS